MSASDIKIALSGLYLRFSRSVIQFTRYTTVLLGNCEPRGIIQKRSPFNIPSVRLPFTCSESLMWSLELVKVCSSPSGMAMLGGRLMAMSVWTVCNRTWRSRVAASSLAAAPRPRNRSMPPTPAAAPALTTDSIWNEQNGFIKTRVAVMKKKEQTGRLNNPHLANDCTLNLLILYVCVCTDNDPAAP